MSCGFDGDGDSFLPRSVSGLIGSHHKLPLSDMVVVPQDHHDISCKEQNFVIPRR